MRNESGAIPLNKVTQGQDKGLKQNCVSRGDEMEPNVIKQKKSKGTAEEKNCAFRTVMVRRWLTVGGRMWSRTLKKVEP